MRLSYWLDVEIIRRKGHIKYGIGDNGTLVVEMRKPNKLFIVRSWSWRHPVYKMENIEVRHLRTRNEAEKVFKKIMEEF